jgi:hypothetical protein
MILAGRVEEHDALALSWDARIVAVRWDLVPWGLVLDLDTPVSEAKGAAMRRAWLVFSGISEVTIPMRANRLPTGIWLTSSFDVDDKDEHGLRMYACRALLPTFDGDRLRGEDSAGELSVRAQSLVAVLSMGSDTPAEYGLAWEVRVGLSSDQDMLSALNG